jgi:hypothetical protein
LITRPAGFLREAGPPNTVGTVAFVMTSADHGWSVLTSDKGWDGEVAIVDHGEVVLDEDFGATEIGGAPVTPEPTRSHRP